MNVSGLIAAGVSFLAIGLGFVWVIRLEYFVGAHVAPWVMALGLIITAGSLFVPGFWGSAITGIIGGTIIWGSTEMNDQELRVKSGQFPANPRKKQITDDR